MSTQLGLWGGARAMMPATALVATAPGCVSITTQTETVKTGRSTNRTFRAGTFKRVSIDTSEFSALRVSTTPVCTEATVTSYEHEIQEVNELAGPGDWLLLAAYYTLGVVTVGLGAGEIQEASREAFDPTTRPGGGGTDGLIFVGAGAVLLVAAVAQSGLATDTTKPTDYTTTSRADEDVVCGETIPAVGDTLWLELEDGRRILLGQVGERGVVEMRALAMERMLTMGSRGTLDVNTREEGADVRLDGTYEVDLAPLFPRWCDGLADAFDPGLDWVVDEDRRFDVEAACTSSTALRQVLDSHDRGQELAGRVGVMATARADAYVADIRRAEATASGLALWAKQGCAGYELAWSLVRGTRPTDPGYAQATRAVAGLERCRLAARKSMVGEYTEALVVVREQLAREYSDGYRAGSSPTRARLSGKRKNALELTNRGFADDASALCDDEVFLRPFARAAFSRVTLSNGRARVCTHEFANAPREPSPVERLVDEALERRGLAAPLSLSNKEEVE